MKNIISSIVALGATLALLSLGTSAHAQNTVSGSITQQTFTFYPQQGATPSLLDVKVPCTITNSSFTQDAPVNLHNTISWGGVYGPSPSLDDSFTVTRNSTLVNTTTFELAGWSPNTTYTSTSTLTANNYPSSSTLSTRKDSATS